MRQLSTAGKPVGGLRGGQAAVRCAVRQIQDRCPAGQVLVPYFAGNLDRLVKILPRLRRIRREHRASQTHVNFGLHLRVLAFVAQ